MPQIKNSTAFKPALLALALSSLLLAGCQPPAEPPAKAPPPIVQGEQLRFAPNHPQLALISLATAAPAENLSVDLPARLIWNEEHTQRLYPAFAGRVSAIKADVGQSVNVGSVLAQLASPDFGAAQADTAKARADARLSAQVLQRQRELFDAGIVARKELEQAEADVARTQAEIQRAESRTRLYGAAESAGPVSQSLSLSAGIRGLVVERNLNPGQDVRPDQSGPGVPPLFVVTDPTSLWVQIDARESDVGVLQPGAAFELLIPGLPGEKFQGRVTAASDFIDPSTRTIKIRGLVANPQRRLKAEMLGTARVQRRVPAGSVMVPAQAVALTGTQHSVLVQVEPGVFENRVVQLTAEGPKQAIITGGLKAGEQVASDNMLLLVRQFRSAQAEDPSLAPKASAPAPAPAAMAAPVKAVTP